ncbi:MAG: phytanoyl-CoA dioxygenase family protein [Rhizobiales bacterium]|nr:phytanoyl-CoA dioxygenase family protein [Hyphomicrobiales bacterium]
MLSQSQIEFYRHNGYLLIENALLPGQLAEMQQVTAGLIEKSRTVTGNNDLFDLEDGHSPQNPRLKRIKLPHTQHRVFWDAVVSDRLASFLKPLLGADIRLHTSKLNTKAPGGGAAVEWHQDWAFYPHTNDDMLALGIMLEDVDEANGPLMVMPGSHRGPVLSHHQNGVFCGAVDPQDPLFDAGKIVTLTGKAGDMTVHHVRTLHGSAPNLSDRARKILFYELSAADAWPINGNAGAYTGLSQLDVWAKLEENIVCGSQPATARLASVPVTMPVPPAPDSSSIFNVQKSGGARSAFSPAA